MVRAPCCEKMGLKKGPWTPQEDQILISYIDKYGHANWRALPKQAGKFTNSLFWVFNPLIVLIIFSQHKLYKKARKKFRNN